MNLEALKAAKKKAGLTIAQIAERANLPKGTVQNIFCGYVPNPRSDTLHAIEHALELDVSHFTPDERASGVVDTLRVSITAEEDNLLVLYREIGRKKGADRQRLFMQIGRLILESE